MKRLKPHLAGMFVAGLAILSAISARAQPSPLSSLAAVHALTNSQAGAALQVAIEATVTYYKKGDMDLFVQDGKIAIYVETSKTTNVSAGDRVLVVGHTRASFRPEIKADSVTVVGRGVIPPPVPATFKQLIRADLDCRRVVVHALVRGMNTLSNGGVRFLYVELLMDGGYIDAQVAEGGTENLGNLLDSEVEISGAVAGKFDSKMQLAGILLEVQNTSDIRVVKRAHSSPASLPLTPMDKILAATDVQDRTERVRVGGTITYYQPGTALVLQDGAKSLWINTTFETDIRLGNRVSASGFPGANNGSIVLNRGEVEDSGVSAPILPVSVNSKELTSGSRALQLVSIDGRLVMSLRQSVQDEYVVISDGELFSAIYRHPERTLETHIPNMQQLPIGSQVRISGICILDQGDQYQGAQAFSILLRSSDDVAILAGPSLLNVRNLVILVGVLLAALLVIGGRGWAIERRLRHEAAELASVEQRRSAILEDINSSTSLVEILDKIVEMVSVKMHGAPCWCALADGTQAGTRPAPSAQLRAIDYRIDSRMGAPMGTISVALDGSFEPDHLVDETIMRKATRLASLAIETDFLHSDLRHRSEFDLLTDIHNRFSLENRLEQLVEIAKSGTFSFGLIYIDLNAFKQINDRYGHDVGDLYLREVVSRMKGQIRPGDMLARIGGDEFALLAARIVNADGAKELASRLRHCFDALFEVDGKRLVGSASFGISICPRDGTDKAQLLKAADAAMYVAKDAWRTASSIDAIRKE